MMRIQLVMVLMATVAFLAQAPRAIAAEDLKQLVVTLGPVAGVASSTRTLVFDSASRRTVTWFDVQDGREHHLRGITLLELLARTKAPRSVDAVIFAYTDGMEIPVQLRDMEEVESIFIALEHGNVMDQFSDVYPLHNAAEIPCPKVVYGRPIASYSIWRYPTQLANIRLVTWKAYEATLAQATRRVPDRSGWPLYLQHCQSCHGIGGNGAKRGPDFSATWLPIGASPRWQ